LVEVDPRPWSPPSSFPAEQAARNNLSRSARFEIPRWRAFNAYSLYSEYQLWFISSDIEGGTVSRIAFGLRVGLL